MKKLFILSTTIMFVLVAVALTIDWHQQAEAAVLIPETGLNPTLPQPPPPGQCTLQVVVEPSNSGSVLVELVKPFYSYGEVVWLTAEPSAGFVFSQWNDEGILLGFDNPMGYAVTASHKITAYFVEQGQALPSPPPLEWQGSVPSFPPPPPLPIYFYILLIIPFVIILGAVILTVVFRPKWLRLVGLILGIVGGVAGFPASFLSCLAAFQSPWSLQLGYVAFSWLIHWAILLVACKWALVGGVLFILDSSLLATILGSGLLITFLHPPRPLFPNALPSGLWLFTFVSLLASGVLFVLSWRERKYLKRST